MEELCHSSIEDLLAGLDVEGKARAKDAPPRAPEGQSSANIVQHAGKKNMKPSHIQEEEDEHGRGCLLRVR